MHPTSWSPATDDVEIADLLRAISRKKLWIGLFSIAAGLAAYVTMSFVTPLYSSQARILIEREDNSYKRPAGSTLQSVRRSLTDQEAVESQIQVLSSQDLAIGVVQDLKLTENPEFNKYADGVPFSQQILRRLGLKKAPGKDATQESALNTFIGKLDVYQMQKSRVIAVNFQSENPQMAARAANRLAEFYLTWQQNEKLKQTKQASIWLSAQIAELTKKVEAADIAAERFRSSSGLLQGSNNITLDAQELSGLNSQLILAKAQRTEAEARAALISKMLKDKGDVTSAADVVNSTLIQRLLEQRVGAQRALAEVSATLLPSHPRIKQLKSELSDLQRRIRQETGKVVTSLQNEAQIAGAREASLRQSLNALKKVASRGNEKQIKLRALEREAKANRDILESYLSRYRDASARRDEASVPAHASIISRARASNTPSFPKKGPMALLAAAAVALLGLAHTVARELIFAQPDMRRAQAQSRQAPGAIETSPGNSFSTTSSIRNLVRLLASRRTRRIVISSVSGSDISTQMIIDTARALARNGKRTILVDATSIGDDIALAMDSPQAPGLHHLLARSANFEETVRRDPKSSLHLISGGSVTGQIQAIDPSSLAQLVEALETAYEQVIFYCGSAEAKSLLSQPCQTEPWLILVADMTSTQDNIMWLSDSILSGLQVKPSSTLLKANLATGWSLLQLPGWKRAAA